MDLNLFATQIVKAGNGNSSAVLGGNGLLGGAAGLGEVSADFWNVIFGNLAEEQTQTEAKTSNNEQAPEKLKKETVDLALLQLALLGQDPDVNIDEKLTELRIERITADQENRVEQLTKLIAHLTSGLPEVAANEGASVEDLVSRLTKRLEKLESRLEAFRSGDFGDEGAPFQLLIATGLNPAQLTNITNRIEEVETKLGRELTVEDLIAGVGNIIPSPGDEDHEFSTTDALEILLDKTDVAKDNEAQASQQADKTINNVTIDPETGLKVVQTVTLGSDVTIEEIEENKTSKSKQKSENNDINDVIGLLNVVSALQVAPAGTPARGLQPAVATGDGSASNTPSLEIAQRLTNADFNSLFGGNDKIIKPNSAKLNPANIGQQSALPKLPTAGDFTLPTNWAESFSAHNSLSEALGFDIQTGTPFNNVMQAVHAASSSQQAGQSHPATQMVAAQITKAAQNSDSKSITLQLDPPELGRVEVRLEFGKDKQVKANLFVEKPETLLMLQRDANALERALQNAGLETDQNSLNYQMADGNSDFNSNREGNAQNGGTGSGHDGEDADENLIETTITWNVDPETGHVRYNLIA